MLSTSIMLPHLPSIKSMKTNQWSNYVYMCVIVRMGSGLCEFGNIDPSTIESPVRGKSYNIPTYIAGVVFYNLINS